MSGIASALSLPELSWPELFKQLKSRVDDLKIAPNALSKEVHWGIAKGLIEEISHRVMIGLNVSVGREDE